MRAHRGESDRAQTALAWLHDALAALDRAGLRRQIRSHAGPQAAQIEVDGRTLINFGSNDYLGLAADPRLIKAAQAALARAGCGAGASPLVTGHSDEHARLEQRLAEFEGAAAALLFPSGFAANVGVISALAGPQDLIYSDQKNHASLIDGCRISRAETTIYPHCDWRSLEKSLAADAARDRRRLIVTDSVFSMDGDLAPLVELTELAERYNCLLVVDEAHATGVFGAQGRGVGELLGVEERIPVRIGTLSKALGSQGGFVVGQRELIDWILNRARTYIFSTALAPSLVAAASAALQIVVDEPARRSRLLDLAATARAGLAADGWRTGAAAGPIIPLFLGDPRAATDLSAELAAAGFYVPAIRPPSVPLGESLLRISLTSEHTPAMVSGLIAALSAARAKLT